MRAFLINRPMNMRTLSCMNTFTIWTSWSRRSHHDSYTFCKFYDANCTGWALVFRATTRWGKRRRVWFYAVRRIRLGGVAAKILEITVYNGLLQSAASELVLVWRPWHWPQAGMELIESLGLEYNKLRQSSITNEISEIVGGANALQ